MVNRIVILAVALATAFVSGGASAARSTYEQSLDRFGYPLDDPEYEAIRLLLEEQERGLSLFRSEKFHEAYEVLEEPARHGFKKAQHALALMHINGTGVEKNILVGVALLGLAAESGDRRLQKNYRKALKALPDKYQSLVRKQVQYYVARFGMEAQGISCSYQALRGSNRKALHCLKDPGNYEVYPWSP